MANEAPGHTLQATALVHEAWLRLGGDQQPDCKNRGHFFIAASEAMRRILVERARRKQRACHGGGLQRVDVESVRIPAAGREDQRLALDEALELFAQEEPEKAQVVKLRYFIGLSHQQTAEVLGLSLATVERY
jgi:RNA polymerase sigma factor (TIGR02999 family)